MKPDKKGFTFVVFGSLLESILNATDAVLYKIASSDFFAGMSSVFSEVVMRGLIAVAIILILFFIIAFNIICN